MFKKQEGYYIIIVNGNKYFMRNNPKDMYSSMLSKSHDALIAFYDTDETKIKTIMIDELEKYIKEVENELQ